ncbi:DEAD/DEAH box helicase family protein [Solwaraspora sp. WMMD1047]|uniref:DEAD/DEAH box helicase family protein n=1 Tax=Solwaraspora sp. WMMD1047 TaxID=3016102 RepID=UPI00241699D8|nr:DEAD/DEAH box helicase family protein [Solwaraspora sp. WMMD1047]MDG4833605.1 DEAD/DEAH box helicase family protein [Solwaraspora sp. WMMD1047]
MTATLGCGVRYPLASPGVPMGRGAAVDERQIRRLAAESVNFGFLRPYPLLLFYGAGAEALVHVDAQSAMFKARAFGDVLTQELIHRTDARSGTGSFFHRVQALNAAGLLTRRNHRQIERLRNIGNQAVHDHLTARQAALELVEVCFELGRWYHRLVTGDRSPIGYREPRPAGGRHRRDEATELVARLEPDAEAAREALDGTRGKRVSASQRDDLISAARRASREPLTETQTRREIDRQLAAAGWAVQDERQVNLCAGPGVALREVGLAGGRADYLLYVDRKLVGVIEAKREGVEAQLDRYRHGLKPEQRSAAWRRDEPLPFGYVATGTETTFVNGLDPNPRTREVFAFHRPESLARWMREADEEPAAPTLRARLRRLPELDTEGLRPAQAEAVRGLERSLAADHPRSLIQMATGAGKTFTAVTASYRLLRHARANRILFLVDRNNLGKQTLREYAGYQTPDDRRKFTELYHVDRLAGAGMLGSSTVVISTIQRLYAVLRGEDLPDVDADEKAYDSYDLAAMAEATYHPAIPPETFDLIVIDECHPSIYGRWRTVLEYFDAFLVGLTASPVKQTVGFFHQNLVSQYTYEQAVADRVNVDFDVYRIRIRQTEAGDQIEAGTVVPLRDRRTRAERYQELADDFPYEGTSVTSKGQLKLVLETFRDRLFTGIFPGRSTVPKTLIFARDDNHAEEIVKMVRQVFARGNDFAAKITYASRRDGNTPDALLQAFRNSPELRIAVTVDMIATGTDVKPLECVFFLREVRSATHFEQLKGRGARTIDPADLQAVTPDAKVKDRFVIVDAVGVTEGDLDEAVPLQRHTEQQVSLRDLLRRADALTASPDEVATLGARLARLDKGLTDADRAELAGLADGQPLTAIVRGLTDAVAPERLNPAKEAGPDAVRDLAADALRPLAAKPELRERILEIRQAHLITIDEVNPDQLLAAARVPPEQRVRSTGQDFHADTEEHRDGITALQINFEMRGRANYTQLNELAARIARLTG